MSKHRILLRRDAVVIAVIHDLPAAARFCDRVALMKDGALIAEGAPRPVLDEERIAEALWVDGVRFEHAGESVVLPWSRPGRENSRQEASQHER